MHLKREDVKGYHFGTEEFFLGFVFARIDQGKAEENRRSCLDLLAVFAAESIYACGS
jgi:hypothetical protein